MVCGVDAGWLTGAMGYNGGQPLPLPSGSGGGCDDDVDYKVGVGDDG